MNNENRLTVSFKHKIMDKMLDDKGLGEGTLAIQVLPSYGSLLAIKLLVVDSETGEPLVEGEDVLANYGDIVHLTDIKNIFTIRLS